MSPAAHAQFLPPYRNGTQTVSFETRNPIHIVPFPQETLMRRAFVVVSLLVGQTSLGLAQAPRQPLPDSLKKYVVTSGSVIALTHVRVIDGTGAPVMEDQTIV